MKTKDESLRDAIRESARKCKREVTDKQVTNIENKWKKLVESGFPEDMAFCMATRRFRNS